MADSPKQDDVIHAEISPESGEQPPGATEFTSLLEDIAADRRSVLKEGVNFTATELSLGEIPEDARPVALYNVRLLHDLNGHRGSMLRKVMARSGTEDAAHLRQLYDWSGHMAEGRDFGHEALTAIPPETLPEDSTPEALYERLLFLERHPDATPETIDATTIAELRDILKLPEGKTKWIDMIPALFNAKDQEETLASVIETLGYIPENLTNRKAFEKVPATALIKTIEALRKLEDGHHGEAARYERSRLLNAMITGGNLRELKEGGGTITLDSSGIFVNAGALHSHIPFGLLSEAAQDALLRDGWMSEAEVIEAKLRMTEENALIAAHAELEEEQFRNFSEESANEELEKYDWYQYQRSLKGMSAAEIAQKKLDATWSTHRREIVDALADRKLILPDSLIDELLEQGPVGVSVLMQIGHSLSERVATNDKYGISGFSNFGNHNMLAEPDQEYSVLVKILNDPRYYNIHKILRAVLLKLPPNNPEEGFIAIRGSYKSARGEQHSFLETFHNGVPARILLNESKHLLKKEREQFDKLPEYDREKYQDLERAIVAYDHFRMDLEQLRLTRRIALTGDEDHRFWKAAQNALGFMQGHAAPDEWRRASTLFDKLEEAAIAETSMREYVEEFIAIVERCDKTYKSFLYASIGAPVNFPEVFMPEIAKKDVEFGERFAEEGREKCTQAGFDEELSRSGASVRVVSLNYREKDPTRAIPFHIEQDALNAARLSPRPFLNVIGGARLMERADIDMMTSVAEKIVGVAHDEKLNVAVPGTQTGIGLLFGRENMRYKKATEHLPLREQAKLFAVSPGGNTYYPGNPYLTPELASQTYAMSPVDTILTPFGVNWDAMGLDKFNSLYINHVAYMEALYARLSDEHKRALLMLNGGLYAVMEATEAYRRGFPLILAEDSGRLAQVLAEYVRHKPKKGPNEESSPDEMYEMVMAAVERLPKNAGVEFMQKDFGKALKPENDDYFVYREYFYRLLKMFEYNRDIDKRFNLERNDILITPMSELESNLRLFYSGKSNVRASPISVMPSIRKW